MKKTHDSNKGGVNRTDELINDYFLDFFGEVENVDGNEPTETLPISKFFESVPIDGDLQGTESPSISIKQSCFLVPTMTLQVSSANSEKYSQVQAMLILLSVLYFLRRPLSPKVRQSFLDLSERAVNDYHQSGFKHRMAPQGVCS